MKTRIAFLADHPEHIAQVAYWHWDEWDREMLGLSLEDVTKLVREHSLHKDRLDINLIALNERNECVGTVELADNEFLPGHEDDRPWLGSLYVDPKYRHRNIAGSLINAATTLAHRLKFPAVYLYTHRLYHDRLTENDFELTEEVSFADHVWRVYRKGLNKHSLLSDANSSSTRTRYR